MIIRIIVAVLLSCSVAFAGQGMGPGPGVKGYTSGGGGVADVLFYFNADSATASQSPQKGTGTVAVGSAMAVGAGQVSGALDTNNSAWSEGSIIIPLSGNAGTTAGTIGFYYYGYISGDTGDAFYVGTIGTRGTIKFYNFYGSTSFIFEYGDKGDDMVITPEAWNFVELAYDQPNGKMAWRVNGGTWTETTGVTASALSETSLVFGWGPQGELDCMFDQIIVSNVYKKDLYSISTGTSF